jgi:phosphatidylglycerophosphate synthase
MTSAAKAPSIAELKEICRKGPRDFFWISNVFWRPLSIYGTWAAVRLGLSANAITLVSAMCALSSSFLLLAPTNAHLLWSAVLMQAFFYLDHVDGEVARYTKSVSGAAQHDLSGGYFDLLVHYFQSASFFSFLGIGIAFRTGLEVWSAVGVIAAIGSSSFPRFVAGFEALRLVLKRSDLTARRVGTEIAAYYSLYWKAGEEPSGMYLMPRNWKELLFAAKQLIWFPGNLFVFALVAALTAFLNPGFLLLQAFLAFYAVLLSANTIYATYHYLRLLGNVPQDDS